MNYKITIAYSCDSAASVGADLTMYDARTGKAVLSKSYYETDDKEVDCLTHIMKDFFNKADKYAKKQMKQIYLCRKFSQKKSQYL